MKSELPRYVHVNGRLVSAHRPWISVFDRGFLYGDGLFETLRAYRGRVFGLQHHLSRLRMSARFLGIALPHHDWAKEIAALLARNRFLNADAWVRITLTRGVAPPALPPTGGGQPTLIISAGPIHSSITRAQQLGVAVTLLPFARQGFLAEHKVLDYMPGVLGKAMAARHRAFEGLFVDNGSVTEGTTTNLFIWRGKQLVTPPVAGVLPGVTRRLVLKLAADDGMQVAERRLSRRELLSADEAFLTSSLVEVLPIVAVDAQRIGTRQVGPRTARLQHLYRQMVDQTLARASRD